MESGQGKRKHGPEDRRYKRKGRNAAGTFLLLFILLCLSNCGKSDEPLQMAFYYENVCASCEGDADFFALYNRCLSPEEKEALNVEIATYNVFMESCRDRYEKESERLGIPGETSLPVLIIGEQWYSGYENMEEALRFLPTQKMKKM